MKRNSVKWAVLGGVIAFMLLYGIEAATTGIESVYGPIGEQRTAPVTELLPEDRQVERNAEAERINPEPPPLQNSAQTPVQDSDGYAYRAERLPGVYGQSREPSVNRMAEQTAGLLQSLSSNGIRLIVSIFDSVTE